MNNTGELTLTLPVLPDGWQWNVKIEERREYSVSTKEFTNTGEPLIIVKAERGIYRDEHGTELAGDGCSGYVYLTDHSDYDEIITEVQKQVDSLVETVKYFDVELKTPADAIKHILDTFNGTAVTQSLHLIDKENV